MNELRVKKYFERIGLAMPDTIISDSELSKILAFHNLIIGLGALAACCGCLLGYAIDRKNNSKDE